jgi:zinc protease
VSRADRSSLPVVGPDPHFIFPTIVRHTLANGLQVRTIEHTSVPVISFVLQVDGGSGADPAGQEGLAAIVADMLDEGTGGLTALDVSDALARIGADYNLDVGADATVLTLTVVSRFAARAASLLADFVIRPRMRDDDFTRVRQLRLDRLRQLRDLPPAVAERAFVRLMYGNHPYGHLAIGNDRALGALTLDDVSAFHRAAFGPDRATLVVAGAASHDELLRLAEDAFAVWRSHGMTPPRAAVDIPIPAQPPLRLAVVPRDGAAQSELRVGHLSARRNTPDYPALLVMNAILGGQFVSRINLKLREEKGYTYGARTGFDWRRGLAPFGVHASVYTAATADAVKDVFDELGGIATTRPPSEQEMMLARASLTRGYPRNFETAQHVARAVGQLALFGLPDTYFEEFGPNVNAVTARDVVRVAETYLSTSKLTTLIVGDHSAIADSLNALGWGAPTVLSAEM